MRFYRADIHLEGDRNHVVPRRGLLAPELAVLMAIHGTIAVQQVKQEGEKKMTADEVKGILTRRYGRVRIGDGDDRRLALRAVYPAWPNLDLPRSAEDAGVPKAQMWGNSPQEKVTRAALEEELRAEMEAEREAEREEFAKREAQLEAERAAFEAEKAQSGGGTTQPEKEEGDAKPLTEMQKLRQTAEALKATDEQLKKATTKVKLQQLIQDLQAADKDFME